VGSPSGDSGQLSAGRLAYGCTDLSQSWPHGGTGLGLVGQVFVFPMRRWSALAQEETNSATSVIWLAGDVVVSLTQEGWDEDAMRVFNPNAETSNSKTVVSWKGPTQTTPAGAPVPTITNVVFTPWDTTNGRGFVIYLAAPVPDLNAELALSAGRFLEVPCVLLALPDGSDRLGKLGKFSELTL